MKLHLLCWVLILVTYKGSAILPIPELHFGENIIEDEDTEVTCRLLNPSCLQVHLEIKGNVTLTDCVDKTADCSKKDNYTTKRCKLEVTKEMDQMEFTCEALFTIQSLPQKMFLQREPTITDCPDKLVWKEEEENMFHCLADGYPLPNVTCTKDGVVYLAGQKYRTFRNMTGRYRCEARNFDSVLKSVEVFVQYKPTVVNITVSPPLHNKGDTVTITCNADGEPPPSYAWGSPSPDVQFSPDNKTITIQKMASSHLGKYRCTASNMHGNQSQERELHLAVRPSLTDLKVKPSPQVLRGSNVTLSCEATGSPPPTLSWKTPKSGVHISKDGRTVSIWNIKDEDAGLYSCTAENKHGSDNRSQQITLGAKPKVLRVNVKPSTSVSENDNLTLTCEAQGVPPPTYRWHPERPNVIVSDDSSTINILGAQKTHAGNYSCTAHNMYGEDTMTKRITVKDKGNRAERREMTLTIILAVLISTSLTSYLF